MHGDGGEATIVVWSPDYDGKGKALVRLADGAEAIVGAPASRCSTRMRLHRCRFLGFEGSHPCWVVQSALDEQSIEYEIV